MKTQDRPNHFAPWTLTVDGHVVDCRDLHVFTATDPTETVDDDLLEITIGEADGKLIAAAPLLAQVVVAFVNEWRETWVDPDEVNHEWHDLYVMALKAYNRVGVTQVPADHESLTESDRAVERLAALAAEWQFYTDSGYDVLASNVLDTITEFAESVRP